MIIHELPNTPENIEKKLNEILDAFNFIFHTLESLKDVSLDSLDIQIRNLDTYPHTIQKQIDSLNVSE